MTVLFCFRCCWLAKSTVACVCLNFPWGQINLQWQGETIWLINNRADFTKSSRNLRMMSVHSLQSLEVTLYLWVLPCNQIYWVQCDMLWCWQKWVRHQSCLQDTCDKMKFIQKRLWYKGKNEVLFLITIALRIKLRTQEMLKCIWLFSHMFSQRDAINTD